MINKDSIFPLVLAILVFAELMAIVFGMRKHKTWHIIILGIALAAQLIFVSMLFDNHWGDFPWGRSSALKTANGFMLDLKNANYDAAFKKLSPGTQNFVTEKDLSQSRVRPVSWHFENIDHPAFVTITGKSVFADGVELPIEIKLRRMNYEWKIYDVRFGEYGQSGNSDSVPRLNFAFCCESYNMLEHMFSLFK